MESKRPVERKLDYSRIYRKWHSDSPEHMAAMKRQYLRALGPHLPADKRVRVLDVGCGMGFALWALRECGYERLEGVDRDESQVASCQAKGLAVHRTDDTAGFLKGRPSGYDLVLALDLIEHIPVTEQLGFVMALGEALSPEGKLICTVPNANSGLAGRYRYIDWTHTSSFTEHSLDFLLYNAGFRTIHVHETEYFERPKRVWLPVGGARHWWAFRLVRLWRRFQMMAELGPAQGRQVPLSLNLLGVASKR